MIEITDFSSYIIWLEKKFDKMCMAYINVDALLMAYGISRCLMHINGLRRKLMFNAY